MPKRHHIREVTMKNRCPNEEMLASYVEGLLTENKRSQVEAHLALCDACREEFKMTNHIVRGGAGVDINTAPPEVTRSAIHLLNTADLGSVSFLKEKIKKLSMALRDRWLQYFHFPLMQRWNLTPVRGGRKAVSEDLFRIRKNYRDFDAEIEIEKSRGEDSPCPGESIWT